ncbi:hypothetical protein FQZ97_1043250 [compost metagenome]
MPANFRLARIQLLRRALVYRQQQVAALGCDIDAQLLRRGEPFIVVLELQFFAFLQTDEALQGEEQEATKAQNQQGEGHDQLAAYVEPQNLVVHHACPSPYC